MEDICHFRNIIKKTLEEVEALNEPSSPVKMIAKKIKILETEINAVHPDEIHGAERKDFYNWYKARQQLPDPKNDTSGNINISIQYFVILNDNEKHTSTDVICYISGYVTTGRAGTYSEPETDDEVDDIEINWIECETRKLNFDEIYSVWIALENNKKIRIDIESALIEEYYDNWRLSRSY